MPHATISTAARLLYNSGSVAAGAEISSGVLDLTDIGALEVITNQTAGTVLRTLTMTSYLADGTTEIDSLVLRKIGYGTAPTGSSYAPGAQRGYIGAHPPEAAPRAFVLYDVTSAADTALDTGALLVEDMESVFAYAACSAGTSQLKVYAPDDAAANGSVLFTAAAASAEQESMIGPGSAVATPGSRTQTGSSGRHVPRFLRYTTTTAGASNTVHLIVTGRGMIPGTYTVPLVLPAKAKFILAAAGSAAARMTILGR